MPILFTEDIVKDPRKMVEQLNLALQQYTAAQGGAGIAETQGGIVGPYQKIVAGPGLNMTQERGALKVSAAATGSGLTHQQVLSRASLRP